ERGVHALRRGVHLRVLPGADQIRSQRHAQRALPEHEALGALALGQEARALLDELRILEQGVIGGQRVAAAGPALQRTCRHHRCSPFQGGGACPHAYGLTWSLILLWTREEFGAWIEE